MLIAGHGSLDHLQVLADGIPQKRSWKRAQAFLLARQGWTASHIATSLRSHRWSNRECEGYNGLQEEAIRSVLGGLRGCR